jgi:chromosomal replication initiation ATPase DnaA
MANTGDDWSRSDRCPRRAADVINAAVAAAFTVPIGELHHRSRRRAPVALARQSAMYLAHVTLGLTFAEVGRVFGRDRTTAAYAQEN